MTSAEAEFVAPNSFDRADGQTTYQLWDVFTEPFTDLTPDVVDENPNASATLSEVGGTALLTGAGNIYSPAVPVTIEVTLPELDVSAPPHDVTVIVQIRTLGTEVDASTLLLQNLAPIETVELSREGEGFDAVVETWNLFNIPYATFGSFMSPVGSPTSLELGFAAQGAHMSLDALSIDSAIRPFGFYDEEAPVPEPASLILLGGAALAMASRRRRN